MKFWGIVEGVIGLIERIVNRPAKAPEDKAAAKKALEEWKRERPRPPRLSGNGPRAIRTMIVSLYLIGGL